MVWFQTGKVKSTKKLYENKFEKYARLFRQTSCLRRPRYLLRSFSSVLELVFMDTIMKWRAAVVLTSVLFEGKSGEKNAEQEEEEFVVLSVAAVLLQRKRACRKLFHCSRRQGNKRKRRCSRVKKKKKKNAPNPLVCSCIAERFSTSCRVPATVNRHKPT